MTRGRINICAVVLLAVVCGWAVPAHIILAHALPAAWHTHVASDAQSHAPGAHAHPHDAQSHPEHAQSHPHVHEARSGHGDTAHSHIEDFNRPQHPFSYPEKRQSHEHSNDGAHGHELLTSLGVAGRLFAPISVVAFVRPLEWPEHPARGPDRIVDLPSLLPSRGFSALHYRRGPPQA